MRSARGDRAGASLPPRWRRQAPGLGALGSGDREAAWCSMILLGRVVFPTRMKIASSTASFDRDLRAGDLTQLEWLDLCVEPLGLDGVLFDARHFPRTDDEYLAQLKKMCVDRGLSVAGVAADAVLEADDLRWIEIALQ